MIVFVDDPNFAFEEHMKKSCPFSLRREHRARGRLDHFALVQASELLVCEPGEERD